MKIRLERLTLTLFILSSRRQASPFQARFTYRRHLRRFYVTLRVAGRGVHIAFSVLPQERELGIDIINLIGSGDNRATLSLADPTDVSDRAVLRVMGNAGDVLHMLTDDWLQSGVAPKVIDDNYYLEFTYGGATLPIDQTMTRKMV